MAPLARGLTLGRFSSDEPFGQAQRSAALEHGCLVRSAQLRSQGALSMAFAALLAGCEIAGGHCSPRFESRSDDDDDGGSNIDEEQAKERWNSPPANLARGVINNCKYLQS